MNKPSSSGRVIPVVHDTSFLIIPLNRFNLLVSTVSETRLSFDSSQFRGGGKSLPIARFISSCGDRAKFSQTHRDRHLPNWPIAWVYACPRFRSVYRRNTPYVARNFVTSKFPAGGLSLLAGIAPPRSIVREFPFYAPSQPPPSPLPPLPLSRRHRFEPARLEGRIQEKRQESRNPKLQPSVSQLPSTRGDDIPARQGVVDKSRGEISRCSLYNSRRHRFRIRSLR